MSSTPIKVAYVLPSLSAQDGWARHARGFVRAVSKHVEPVFVVATEDVDQTKALFPDRLVIALPAVQRAFIRRKSVGLVLGTLMSVRRQSWPAVDLVHSLEAYPTGMIGDWIATRLRKPHVITAHGSYALAPLRGAADRLAYRRILKKTAAFCTVSQGTADLVRKHFPKETARLELHAIPNGNDFHERVPRSESESRCPASPPVVLTVGSIKRRKGQLVGLKAFARLKQRIPGVRYHIVGSPQEQDYYNELVEHVRSNGLQDVSFLGRLGEDDLTRSFREAAVLLVPSQQIGWRFEGFGLVCLEAGAFGVPVVASRTGGIPDAIRDGETGILVDPDDIEGMAAALRRIICDPSMAAQMARSGRRWAETLTWDLCAERQLDVYKNIGSR